MTVDFEYRSSPAIRAATLTWTGPWNEAKIRAQFRRVAGWAKSQHLRTGRWIFREHSMGKWEVGIELRGSARSGGGIRVRTYPRGRVARVVFDPDVVSPRVVYHGLNDWLKWQRKEKKAGRVVATRELYAGDPWTDAKAWARTEIQFVLGAR